MLRWHKQLHVIDGISCYEMSATASASSWGELVHDTAQGLNLRYSTRGRIASFIHSTTLKRLEAETWTAPVEE